MDIISFELMYVKDDCPDWPWPTALSANNHLPSLLVILWRYYQCKERARQQRQQQLEEEKRRQQARYTGWGVAKPQYTYNYSNYDNNYYYDYNTSL
jgi:hypothetical protein